jgi:hypothetical protein
MFDGEFRPHRVTQPALPSVSALEPAQHVIEGPVLHHQDDDVLDP